MVGEIRRKSGISNGSVKAEVMVGQALDLPSERFDSMILDLILAVISDPKACIQFCIQRRNMLKLNIFTVVTLICLGLLTACSTDTVSDIQIHDAWVRPINVVMPEHTMESMPNDSVTAAYLTLENRGSGSDRLTSITTDIANSAEIHQTQIDDRGIASMQWQENGIEIPSNTTVMIEPGGYHIMLTGLQTNLSLDETISLTLTFESGKTINVEAVISDYPPE